MHFTPDGDSIRFGLSAIKGVGEGAVASIIEERESDGPFKSLQDFVARCDKTTLNARDGRVPDQVRRVRLDRPQPPQPARRAAQGDGTGGHGPRDKDDPQISLFDMMSDEGPAG